MTEFASVGKIADVDADSMTSFAIDGWEVVVANVEGRYVAFDGRCTCMSLFSGHTEARALLSNRQRRSPARPMQPSTALPVAARSRDRARSRSIPTRCARRPGNFWSRLVRMQNDASGTTPRLRKQYGWFRKLGRTPRTQDDATKKGRLRGL